MLQCRNLTCTWCAMTNKQLWNISLFYIFLLVFLILVNRRNLNMINSVHLHEIYIPAASIAWKAVTRGDTFLFQVDSLKESQNDRMVWVGRDMKGHPVSNLFHVQRHLPLGPGCSEVCLAWLSRNVASTASLGNLV